MQVTLILLILMISVTSSAGSKSEQVIYGTDDRIDVIFVKNPRAIQAAKSVAIRFYTLSSVLGDKGSVSFNNIYPLSDSYGLNVCRDEKFAGQTVLGDCTGFLVADDLLVTAGHCVVESRDTVENGTSRGCREFQWMFDYKVSKLGTVKLKNISKDNVYSCKKVIYATYQAKDDYAVIQLDRKVKNRKPIKLRSYGSVSAGMGLYVIGHPSGLPMKYSDNALVQLVERTFFVSNLDVFQGSSGSPVFNSITNNVEGIVVRGESDYIVGQMEDGQQCMRANVCNDKLESCFFDDPLTLGESVTPISKVLPYLN